MSAKNNLFWEKWRPKTKDDLVLVPRIAKIFENGISRNFILSGNFGVGKTSLVRILLKGKNHIEINGSLETSIDLLRNQIREFCDNVPMIDPFDENVKDNQDDMKYVFLDEFERTSPQFQDAFKAFVEKYHKKVRFILATNHLNKVDEGIFSRFSVIDFNPQSVDETKFMMNGFYKRVKNVILPAEGFDVDQDVLVKLIKKKFPDFRSIMNDLQHIKETGEVNNSFVDVNTEVKEQLYSLVYDKKDSEEVYHFLMNKFGADRIDDMLKLLGRPFIEYIMLSKRDDLTKLFKITKIVTDYSALHQTSTDPIVLGVCVIGLIQEVI